jgi:hypothetical protein
MSTEALEVESVEQLAIFVFELAQSIREGQIQLHNVSVDSYLEALSGFMEDSAGFYKNEKIAPQSVNPYRLVADALDAATVYD